VNAGIAVTDDMGDVPTLSFTGSADRMGAARGDASDGRPRILLLAGTSEARALAARLAADPRRDAVASLAGRTSAPAALALPTRVGGFGGVAGLTQYLAAERITHVVDATHPFAAQMSANTLAACSALGLPLIVYARAPWRPAPGDRWIEVADNAAAARALGAAPRRAFLTIGRQGVADFRAAPQHDYLLRVIEPPETGDLPPRCEILSARGPFTRDDEIALMREKRVDVVVSKNSGGPLTYAKIEAARVLGLPVVMIAPPPRAGAHVVHDIDAVMALLAS
jgi:precorrin-6A/cobalt-precorrin-6A reductase